jgi:hypothetical protein
MRSGWALATPEPLLATTRLRRVMTELHHITLMQWLALREAWWPISVAVAWVLLRDRSVVEQFLELHSYKPITFVDTFAAFWKVGGGQPPQFANSKAAFRALEHRWQTDEIKIAGTYFVREGGELKMGKQQTIPYAERSSLRYFDDHEAPCLIPRDRRAAHGSSPRINLWGYRNVVSLSATLVRAFPEAQSEHIAPDAVVPAQETPVSSDAPAPVSSEAPALPPLPEEPRGGVPEEPGDHKKARGAGGWIADEVKRMKEAGEIPPGINITDFAKELERRMRNAAKIDESLRPIKARTIENGLRTWGLWPITSIK